MDAFLDYEEQLKELCVSLRKHAEVIPTAKGDAKRKAIATARDELDEASEVLQSLTLAAHGLGTQAAKAKVKTFEQELASLRSNIDRAKMLYGASTDRDELFSGGTVPADLATTSMDHRQRVAADTEKLKRTTDVIREAQQSAESTVQLGIGSLAELQSQKETIQNSQAKLRIVDQHLATGQRIMRGMARRIMTNKLITLLIALILIGGIILIIYLKWLDNPDDEMMTTGDGSNSTDITGTFAGSTAAQQITTLLSTIGTTEQQQQQQQR